MSFAVVVVTYNRPALLAEVLDALQAQTTQPDAVIVVDNASSQETQTLLAGRSDIDVVCLEMNLGGAGGFRAGLEYAIALGHDWIFMIDDDAVPRPDCLSQLAAQVTQAGHDTGALCTAVVESGALALQHRRSFDAVKLAEPVLPASAYDTTLCTIDTGSFVGFLVSRNAIESVGLPSASFFLAYDDTEYSLRLKRAGWKIRLVPAAIVDHKRESGNRLRNGPYGLKHYYNLRNQLVVFHEYGYAAAWRFYIPLFKHAVIALKDHKWASLALLRKAWRDSRHVRIEY